MHCWATRYKETADKVWTKKNQLTTRLITNQTTADDPSDYGKERTRGREKFDHCGRIKHENNLQINGTR